MATLENATFDEIVTLLERKLQLNRLEDHDDNPVPTMSTATTATRHGNGLLATTATRHGNGLLSSSIDPGTTCNYCKKPGHTKYECPKLKRKEEAKRNDGWIVDQKRKSIMPHLWQIQPPGRTMLEKRRRPTQAQLKDETATDKKPTSQSDANTEPTTSIFKNPND